VNGEVLVSVHLNGSSDRSKNGTLGLWGKRTKDLAVTEVLHRRLARELGVPDLGVTNFASGVLLKSDMPATLQEAVFISNTGECGLLTDGTGKRQQQIARSLYNGLVDWFAR
jgi:N-acetylmuramoyl-L-alanine amidase